MNEEEVKQNTILPYLQNEMGIEIDDLNFESTFSVVIGRNKQTVRGYDQAGGRLDILVKKGDKNLLIVEAKSPNHSLTEDDRDQATSYAVLVYPRAPYSLVTNGRQFNLYNSVTRESLDVSEFSIDGYKGSLPEEDLVEAQKLFLRLNKENLLRFCESQVSSELSRVRGSIESNFKYVPELHVVRQVFLKTANYFSDSENMSLLITSDSGIGKTCELCWVTEQLLAAKRPVCFLNGSSIHGSLLGHIAAEFQWEFNHDDSDTRAIKRLSDIVSGDTPLTIVVDAIDEYTNPNRAADIANTIKALEGKNIKLILSCKGSAADSFFFSGDTPTHTKLLSNHVVLPILDPKEFYGAVKKYRSAFNFQGGFEKAVVDEARRNTFSLRMLFEVASNEDEQHLTFDSVQFFDRYLERIVSKTSRAPIAERILTETSRILYEKNEQSIDENELRTHLNLDIGTELMPDLFEYNILVRNHGVNGEKAISFYFNQFRNYLTSFRALNLPKLSEEEVISEHNRAKSHDIRSAVFVNYYRLASEQHKRYFDGSLRINANKYLDAYIEIIETNFPQIIESFSPNSPTEEIGLIGELNINHGRIDMYGFRRLIDGDDRVVFVPTEASHYSLMDLYGTESMHSVSDSNGLSEGIHIPADVVKDEIISQIIEIVKTGELRELEAPDLLRERIVGLMQKNNSIFLSNQSPGGKYKFPIASNIIEKDMMRNRLHNHFQHHHIETKREAGEVTENWGYDGSVNFSVNFTQQDSDQIAAQVNTAMESETYPTNIYMSRDTWLLNQQVSKTLTNLSQNGEGQIRPPFFPLTEPNILADLSEAKEELGKYLELFFESFVSNYKAMVDNNFPTLKHHFDFPYNSNRSIYFILHQDPHPPMRHLALHIDIYYVESEYGNTVYRMANKVERNEEYEITSIDDIQCKVISTRGTTVNNILGISSDLDFDSFEHMPLRSMVYENILEELTGLESEGILFNVLSTGH